MRSRRRCLVAVLPLALAACPGEEAPPPGAPPAEAPPAAAPAEPMAPPVAPGQIRLEPVGGSGVTGQASLTGEAGGTRVEIAVRDAEPGVRLQANLVTGTCDDLGGGVADIDLFFVDDTGAGTSSAVTAAEMRSLQAAPHSLVLQQPERGPEPIVACGVVGGAEGRAGSP